MGNSGSHSADINKRKKHKKAQQPRSSTTENSKSQVNGHSAARESSAKPASVAKEIMISYSRSDSDVMTNIKAALEKDGLTVWNDVADLDAGADFLSKIGQAVIDCKVFLFIVSPKSIESKFCQDELALAYVSNKAILPVGLGLAEDLFTCMDMGMRLQLARFEWYDFTNLANFNENMSPLIAHIKEVLGNAEGAANTWFGNKEVEDDGKAKRPGLNRQMSRGVLRTLSSQSGSDEFDVMSMENMKTFWERHFDESTEVPWFDFVSTFSKEYKKQIDEIFKENKDKVWLISILHRELEVTGNKLKKLQYDHFCHTGNGRQPFWVRVQDQAVESYTIREVFNMESSVRVEAIENLGKFKSPAVVEALIDLLSDSDNNVKAVAAISLARTETNTPKAVEKLLTCLDDKDRLVRESGCLALGHLQVEEAVPQLIQLWRNDFISTVREAASIALEQIGGEEANKAIHMTKVLSEEIRQLTS